MSRCRFAVAEQQVHSRCRCTRCRAAAHVQVAGAEVILVVIMQELRFHRGGAARGCSGALL